MSNAKHEAIQPDIEVVVRTGAGELAIIGLFVADPQSWDVVVGIVDSDERAGVEGALQIALSAVQGASFMEPRMVGGTDTEEADAPF